MLFMRRQYGVNREMNEHLKQVCIPMSWHLCLHILGCAVDCGAPSGTEGKGTALHMGSVAVVEEHAKETYLVRPYFSQLFVVQRIVDFIAVDKLLQRYVLVRHETLTQYIHLKAKQFFEKEKRRHELKP